MFICRKIAAITVLLYGITLRADEPTRYPNYLTLRSDNQGTSHELNGTTYAWGWFGAEPRGSGSRYFGCGWPTIHTGTSNNLWLWWYE